jgi:hypothetical protein
MLREATLFLRQEMPHDANLAGSAGYAYLQLFGYVALGVVWAHAARVANQRTDKLDGSHTQDFRDAKVATAHFYVQHLLPNIERCLASIRAGSGATMQLAATAF